MRTQISLVSAKRADQETTWSSRQKSGEFRNVHARLLTVGLRKVR
jgi:xanthine dehydrogenase molybdopterin-binding subunit B